MRMTSHFRLDDSFTFRPAGRHEADQSQEDVAVSLQAVREWSPASTRGLLVMDLVILKHGQMTRATPELAPPSPNYHTSPMRGHFSYRWI
ncbi:hypothetical protein TNCV_1406571 [Trichonephila clavipes]|nr:hypothetical protein TNCV_1406571 [Trichonephila clavipes]